MQVGRTIAAWIARHFLALLLILVVLIIGQFLLGPARQWLSAELAEAREVSAGQVAHEAALADFHSWARRRSVEAQETSRSLDRQSEAALRRRLAIIPDEIGRLRPSILGGPGLALAAARGDSAALLRSWQAEAEIVLLEREAALINSLLATRRAGAQAIDLRARRDRALALLRRSHAEYQQLGREVARLQSRPLADARNLLCRTARPPIGCRNWSELQEVREKRARALALNRRALAEIRAIDRALSALETSRAALASAEFLLAEKERDLAGRLQELRGRSADNMIIWVRKPLLEMLPTAFLILAVAMFGPGLFKAFLYFVIAPVAERRPAIRLVPGERGEVTDRGLLSAATQTIALAPGEELLILPEAVQSSPHGAAKDTVWLLDWSMPLSSLAAGMAALVRIRPVSDDFVLAAATGDPFAEVGLVDLAEGSAMVIRPRALRGLVRRQGEAVKISRHWRLGHFSAWLTLQFRYLVFHGPCRLIIQGGRGVRLEPAARGRGINQASMLGFSAGLSYSVRRSEAFGPFLLGRQELFNDSFDGKGFALYEAVPTDRRRGGLWGRGLRGLGDAFLKIFGL